MTTETTPSEAEMMQAVLDMQPPFWGLLGDGKITHVSKDRICVELVVGEALGNRNGVMHGGAVMGFADNIGGTATFLNLPKGAATTTIESKTNFFAAIAIGDTARAECTPLHRGRSTMVWQTRITRGDGKLAALVTQTQMVMPKS
jgi:1,4-dihydroxy-2-naphthoyl-CoA hydrolase